MPVSKLWQAVLCEQDTAVKSMYFGVACSLDWEKVKSCKEAQNLIRNRDNEFI